MGVQEVAESALEERKRDQRERECVWHRHGNCLRDHSWSYALSEERQCFCFFVGGGLVRLALVRAFLSILGTDRSGGRGSCFSFLSSSD